MTILLDERYTRATKAVVKKDSQALHRQFGDAYGREKGRKIIEMLFGEAVADADDGKAHDARVVAGRRREKK